MKNYINKYIKFLVFLDLAWPNDRVTYHNYLAICWNIFRVLKTSPTPSFLMYLVEKWQ